MKTKLTIRADLLRGMAVLASKDDAREAINAPTEATPTQETAPQTEPQKQL